MGQHGSCIQGNAEWHGAYEKASIKSQESEIYKQIRKLASDPADLKEFENFLKNTINPTCPQHGKSSSKSSAAQQSKLEELFKKESQCKDINFNVDADSKEPLVKPLIMAGNKSPCRIHDSPPVHRNTPCRIHQQEAAVHHQPCRVHHNDEFSKVQVTIVDKVQPPTYIHPPQRYVYPKTEMVELYDNEENEDGEASVSTFVCPDFLKDLLLPSEDSVKDDVLASIGVQSAKEQIESLEARAEGAVETFGVVLKHLEHGDWSTFCISTSRLCDDVKRVMRDYHLNTETEDIDAIKIKNHVTAALDQLTTHILSLNQATSSAAKHNTLLPSFKVLGETLHEMMEFLISKALKVLIGCLSPENNSPSLRMATCALAEMVISGSVMCKLIVEAGAITPLLNICKTQMCHYLHPVALRVLTTLCSSMENVEEFEKCGGFTTALNLLKEESEEKILSEVAGLLAQVLKVWTEANCSISTKVGQDLDTLVQCLSGTAKRALSPEMFLLSAACLATLAPISNKASDWLDSHAYEMRLLATANKQESYV